jgi:hypothetical protein
VSRGLPRGVARVGAALAVALACALGAGTAQGANGLSFQSVRVQKRPGDGGLPWAEPRIAIGPDQTHWVVTNREQADGKAIVLGSRDGLHWTATPGLPAGQTSATPDVDILAMPNGRLLASELDDAGINFPTSVSDDRGKTWKASTGSTQLADQDRQWFAYGPPAPGSTKPRVYFLFHNLASGQAQHNMFVATSTDGGETFGAPIPVALPGSDAYLDLQCADSGGPSAIWVNQHDGTVYAEYTTRATPTQAGDAGGCTGPASGQPFEFNIVAATRVWLAQSTDGGQTWTNSLAVDDAKSGQIVSMQVASGGLDRAGNVYVAYPEGPLGRIYPDYSGAGVRYKWARPAKDGNFKWSGARTLVASDKTLPGNVLVHMQAGDPGRLIAEYWRGQARKGKDPVWFLTASQTTDGLNANPHVKESRVSNVPADTGTASKLMGACHQEFSVVSGIVNGLTCGRSPDVWGLTANARCRAESVWPAVDAQDNPNDTSANPPKVAGNNPGTWVSLQTGGPSLCGKSGEKPYFAGGCPDQKVPVSSFAAHHAVTLNNQRLTIKGSASDEGCISANLIPGAGRVDQVLVSIAKVRGKGNGKNCSFLKANGRLTGFQNCRRPVVHRASGTTSWTSKVPFPPNLPRGAYRIVARAIDVAGNREPPAHTRFALTFR